MITSRHIYLAACVLFLLSYRDCLFPGFAGSVSGRTSAHTSALYQRAKAAQATGTCGVKCSTERWSIKTLTDRETSKINFKPVTTTVHDLVSLPMPSKPPTSTRLEIEKKTFQVKARLVGYKLEPDKDFLVVIRDLINYNETMVLEIPSTACAGACSSDYKDKFIKARAAIIDLLGPAPTGKYKAATRPIIVEVTGVAFFDVPRKQTGMAPNGIELHPVLSIGPADSAR